MDNPNTGESHGHSETRDGSTVKGEYTVMEPDGVLRRVQYTADPKNGFRALVRFVRPDGESSSHEHGYHGGGHDHGDEHNHGDGQDHGSGQDHSGGQDHGGGQDHDGGHDRPQYTLSSLSQLSNYESDGDAPPSPPSEFHFDFDRYNNNNNIISSNNVDVDDDYENESGPSFFKFPSASGSIYKATQTGTAYYINSPLKRNP